MTAGDGRPAGDAAGDSLSALGVLAALRADHDRTELELIDGARRGGASWFSVARALGLRSRQAAEQRWRRLRGQAGIIRSSQQVIDDLPVALVRHQAVVVGMLLAGRLSAEAEPVGATDGNHPWRAVSLAWQTLSQARGAPAGALHDLARLAVGDLRRVPADVLGQPLADAVSRLACLVDRRQT